MSEWSAEERRRGFQRAVAERTMQRRLEALAALPAPRVLARQESPDGGARKMLLAWEDGACTEVVLMRYRERLSACVSTQVGCACGCVFCATGQAGFSRNLSGAEIAAQVLYLQQELAPSATLLSNFVLMGMGEPLLNYEATIEAVRRLVDPRGAAFVPRRITLSTVGVVDGILRLAGEGLGIRLAVSLHAATDELRDRLVPVNRRWPLHTLFEALRGYQQRTRQRVMVEWVMIDGVNDSVEQARALAERLAGLDSHVNVIGLNPTPHYAGRASPPQRVAEFIAVLEAAGVPHTMRQRRGTEIAAGCGQLMARSA
jgi:23S rRNA (adenine2503-C2)-methyltransferase